ncbi:uncharacterized protein TEOVI_000240900 [Trypanosoma equiperdum]|uniref:Uncharacterized protein n=4 Tax=Trypanozoon TaxID=39700 RepID=Q384T9_TRYB2|nr:hypothetical protein, conserved [Trypanosoma brucei gambiense DAL972]XP_828804.1 hypothetical protein, conserved [Trypanosoma brucei brucei TREU927]RHW67164.1 hypothetical protein DPX39_000030800 [Trypanosoma brucei equiperdum]SCU70834.1 hypothetical protein, conserved [Trypanosoma equiperdum]EAN79692.1 hypothetical protein, conserved [Trypanosoma brucei brucei TREU927]CBH17711.1 hypothetical protein, conserved [Trypanosoma brucei gambiense DAL972]|eukprot:XP_011779975.1 hypothetical protein, conserved [Trypanosoma brucei gambiense DAL972]
MRQPFPTTWKVYLPGLFVMAIYTFVIYFNNTRGNLVKAGHDFTPIYSEEGKLEGFTHPVLVRAGDNYRSRENAKADSS